MDGNTDGQEATATKTDSEEAIGQMGSEVTTQTASEEATGQIGSEVTTQTASEEATGQTGSEVTTQTDSEEATGQIGSEVTIQTASEEATGQTGSEVPTQIDSEEATGQIGSEVTIQTASEEATGQIGSEVTTQIDSEEATGQIGSEVTTQTDSEEATGQIGSEVTIQTASEEATGQTGSEVPTQIDSEEATGQIGSEVTIQTASEEATGQIGSEVTTQIDSEEATGQIGSEVKLRADNNQERTKEKGNENDGERRELMKPENLQRLLADALTYKSKVADLETIVQCGADVNGPVKRGLRPLHYAVHTGYLEGIRFLLRKKADVNAADDIGYRPVHLCARKGNTEAMQILIDNGACVDFFADADDISDSSRTLRNLTIEPLNLALENNHEQCARMLLSQGAKPNHHYFLGYEINLLPLDNLECLKLLLEFGADPNVFSRCGLSPLMKAAKQHNIRAARILLDGNAHINLQPPGQFEQKTPIHYAIESGSNGITNMFLRRGAVVGRPPGYKYAALHTAVVCGKPDFCALLLRWDAKVDELTDEGSTPLQLACAVPSLKHRLETIRVLLEHGANVNVSSGFVSFSSPYLSPLTEYMRYSADSVEYDVVYLLVASGAKVSFKAASTSSRARDPHGILHCVQYLKDKPAIFHLLVNVSRSFDVISIGAYSGLNAQQKETLLSVALNVRDLKSCVRFCLRDYLGPALNDCVQQFPVPEMIKNFLLYKY